MESGSIQGTEESKEEKEMSDSEVVVGG